MLNLVQAGRLYWTDHSIICSILLAFVKSGASVDHALYRPLHYEYGYKLCKESEKMLAVDVGKSPLAIVREDLSESHKRRELLEVMRQNGGEACDASGLPLSLYIEHWYSSKDIHIVLLRGELEDLRKAWTANAAESHEDVQAVLIRVVNRVKSQALRSDDSYLQQLLADGAFDDWESVRVEDRRGWRDSEVQKIGRNTTWRLIVEPL